MSFTIEHKKELFIACTNYINDNIKVLEAALNDAQEAANSDTKGSAGDKHETGRAMMHIEKEKNAKQLSERLRLLEVLRLINPDESSKEVKIGSLVSTNNGIYFISIAMGKFNLDEDVIYIISPVSPIGQLLLGKVVGDEVKFNGRKFVIKGVV